MRIKIRDLQCKGNQWGFNVEFPGIRVNTSPLTLGILTGPEGKGLFAYSDRTPLKGFEDIDLRYRSVAANKALLKNLRGVDLMLAHPDTDRALNRIKTAQAEADASEKVEAGKAKLTGLTFMPETAEATFFVGDTQFIVGQGKLMRQPFDPAASADSFDFSLEGIKSESGARRRLQKFFQENPEVLRGGAVPQHA